MESISHKVEARKRMLAMFPRGVDSAQIYHNYTDNEYLEVLQLVKPLIPFKKEKQNALLFDFLYAGCLKFDRFVSPVPSPVDPRLFCVPEREH